MVALFRVDTGAASAQETNSGVIRVIVVDDHPIARVGLRAGLERYPEICIAGEAADGESAVKLASEQMPDVALVDVRLPQVDGVETARRIREVSPATRIVLMSGIFTTSDLERGLQVGALGFALKTEAIERLAAFVRDAHSGQFCCSADIGDVFAQGPHGYVLTSSHGPTLSSLTGREREMLSTLATGASLKQAAHTMGISYKVADHLKQRLMKKLQIHDRVELVRFAIREGIAAS
jgi:DNA-binding NarL/FixJ family response regulator